MPGVILAHDFPFRGVDLLRLRRLEQRGSAGTGRERGDSRMIERLVDNKRAVSAPGMVVFTFVTTFAFIDWIMSLEPHWFSTIYGVMFLIGQVSESFAFTIIALVIVLGDRRAASALHHEATSARSGKHDVRLHGAVGIPFVFTIPDHLERKSAQ